jgi:hypothetical protein
MTSRRLSDDQLAAGLRVHLPAPGTALRERILAEITTTPQARRLPWILGPLSDADPLARRRMLLLVALLALALAATAVAAAGALLQDRRTPDLSVVPPTDLSVVPPVGLPVVPPSVLSVVGGNARGWPSTAENAAGVYSWDGSTCSSTYCSIGVMHNGYGSGDVLIRIQFAPENAATAGGGTPVTLAGHDAIYRRTDQLERWTLVIEGQAIDITLEARPGTSPADLADGHAIIGSMRTEPRDTDLGFRLVFTIPTDDWDSG